MILSGMLMLVWIICFAMLWNESMWSNCINFVNVLLAALIAMNYWEPAADFIDAKQPSYTYLIDFLTIWFLFFLAFNVLRTVTDFLSKTQVKFKMPIEITGKAISALAIGWVMVCLFLTSLHTAPLARTAVKGGFQATPMSKNFFGMLAPDRLWLGYVQHRSKNALSSSPPKVFDENADFIFKYGHRRQEFSKLEGMRKAKNPF